MTENRPLALATGASSGIGLELARELARLGLGRGQPAMSGVTWHNQRDIRVDTVPDPVIEWTQLQPGAAA